MPQQARTENLNAALRAAASRVAGTTSGCALVFAICDDQSTPQLQLRAAAGFANAEEARRASEAVIGDAQQAIDSGQAGSLEGVAALGSRGGGEAIALPLHYEGRTHGALIAAAPGPLEEVARQTVDQLASSAGVHLDHLALIHQVEQDGPDKTSGDADELLKLSEELFAQDIQLLRSNEKLGKIEKLKNDFIEKMSLELRTPLNSIIESTITVLASEHDALSEAGRATLRMALDEGTAFQRTLQNILDLWRIKQSELPIEISEVNFSEVLEETLFSVQETLDAKEITVRREIEEPLPRVMTDLGKINQIVFLILDNAAKFTDQGEVTVRAKVEKDHLHCSISDTGIGICPDDQRVIFDEFYQVDDSPHGYRGAGLGLTLVRDLLILLEGECTVESEAGRGSTFSFSIPIQLA